MPLAHKHYWRLVGSHHRWFNGHALIRCVRDACDAWSVGDINKGDYGPCTHVVALPPTQTEMPPEAAELLLDFNQCPDCGAVMGRGEDIEEHDCTYAG